MNLISNALKFTFTGHIKVKAIVMSKDQSNCNIMGVSIYASTTNSDKKKESDTSHDS